MRVDEAIRALEQGVTESPEALELQFALALFCWRAGRFDVIDCVSTPYLPLLTAAAVAKAPLVSTWLEVWQAAFRDYLPLGGALAARIERAAAARPRRLLANSEPTSSPSSSTTGPSIVATPAASRCTWSAGSTRTSRSRGPT